MILLPVLARPLIRGGAQTTGGL